MLNTVQDKQSVRKVHLVGDKRHGLPFVKVGEALLPVDPPVKPDQVLIYTFGYPFIPVVPDLSVCPCISSLIV